MERIYEGFEKYIYPRIKGHIWGIAGGLLGLIEIFIAVILHSLTEPITFFSHFVSNLGVGPNGSAQFWNIFSFLCAWVLIPFMPYISKILLLEPISKKNQINNIIVKIAFWISMVSGLGLMILSAFNMSAATIRIHAVGAGMFFIGDLIFMFLYTTSMYLNGKKEIILYVMESLIMIFFIGMLISMMIVASNADMNIFSLSTEEILEFISNMSDDFQWIRFFEWLVTLTMLVWFVVLGYISKRWSTGVDK